MRYLADLQAVYDKVQKAPVNSKGEILKDIMIFAAGTHRETALAWLEKRLNIVKPKK